MPARVELLEEPVEARDAQHVDGEREEPVAAGLRLQAVRDLGQPLVEALLLAAPALLGLPLHARGLLVEVHEDPDLGAEDLGVDRGADVVHRPQRVDPRDVLLVVLGGEEDDGRRLRALALADEGGGLEAVHARHVHVQQDHREVLVQDVLQRLLARLGLDQVLAELGQDGLQDDELVGTVVHEEDADLLLRAVPRGHGLRRPCGRACCGRPSPRTAPRTG